MIYGKLYCWNVEAEIHLRNYLDILWNQKHS